MQEKLEMEELEKSLLAFRTLTEKMTKNLENVNGLITENINSGIGVWDSSVAEMYRVRWEVLMQDFPNVIETFQKQENNLEEFINNLKKVEES